MNVATTPSDANFAVRTDGIDRSQADWYKDAVIYQLHIKAFMDSNGDGIGDFEGLTQRLDYVRDLGVTALELLPVFQFDFSVSRKMIRVSGHFSSVSDHTYQSRAADPGLARRARWNQGCWSEVWLITSSVMTRMPRRCASFTKALKSFIDPYEGLIER